MITKRGRKNVVISWIFLVFAICFVGSSAFAAELVSFKGTTKVASGDLVTLTGKLTKPQGNGPFPAVVLLHGCRGGGSYQDVWAERLASWGYVALQVDSFGPRGVASICDNENLIYTFRDKRAQDAYDAKSYLLGLPFVDGNRVGVMGWSHGGYAIIAVVNQKRNDPFRSAIAIYPLCERKLSGFNAPLLILIGEEDDWTMSYFCTMRMESEQKGHEVILKVYPGAHHGFDMGGMDTLIEGHKVLYDPVAAADAFIQVETFLTKHME